MTYGRLCLRRLYVVGTVDHARIVTTSGKILPSIQMVRFFDSEVCSSADTNPMGIATEATASVPRLAPLCHVSSYVDCRSDSGALSLP